MPNNPLVGNLRQLSVAKEPSWATVTAGTTADQFPPITNPKFEDVYDPVEDDNFRSRMSKVQGWQQGFRSSKYTFETHAYPDVLGNLLMSIYGTDGYTSGVIHPFSVLNTGVPASYTLQDFYGIAGTHTRSMVGMYCDSISIAGTDKGPMKVTVGFSGGKFTTLVNKPSGVFTALAPWMFWQATCTLNSVVKTNLMSWTLDFKRAVVAIPGAGSQDPTSANSTDFECSGKMMFETTDDSEYLLFNTSLQAPFPLIMSFTSGSNVMLHTMTKCQFISPTTFDTGPYIKTNVSFIGIDNATDGGASATQITGGKSTGAY